MKTIAKPLVQHNQIFIVLSVASALLLNQNWILWVPLLANLSALVYKKHPVMIFTRRWLNSDLSVYAQEDPADLRFNQTIVVTLLSSALFLSALGLNAWALVPSLMVLSACVVALMGFCIGCFIRFQLNQLRYRYLQSKSI